MAFGRLVAHKNGADEAMKALQELGTVWVEPFVKYYRGQPYHRGPRHWSWQGGSSFEEYGPEFNDELKEQIRARDNYTCRVCGKTEEELGKVLSIHHIDFNKKNNAPWNLISLCAKHNIKANTYREVSWLLTEV